MTVRAERMEAPMIYVSDTSQEFKILVLDVMKDSRSTSDRIHLDQQQRRVQITWRWITNPNIGEKMFDAAGNNALDVIYKTLYDFSDVWPYKPLRYMIEEIPS